jgi:hypothetical protein
MNEDKFRLTDEDFALLLPTEVVTVGKSLVPVAPLGIADLQILVQKLSAIHSDLVEAGITLKNYSDESKLLPLVDIIMGKAPTILSDASGIAVEDLRRLPLTSTVKIASEVLRINVKSQEGLEKNLSSLADMIARIQSGAVGKTAPTGQGSVSPSKGSSKQGTRGKQSKGTRQVK